MSKVDFATDLVEGTLEESTSTLLFDADSYFDDWLDDGNKNTTDFTRPAGQNESEECNVEVCENELKASTPINHTETDPSPKFGDESSSRPSTDVSDDNSDESYNVGSYSPVFDDDDDGFSYDHYELVRAGGKPYAPVPTFDMQDDTDSGVVIDVAERGFHSKTRTSSSSGKMSFDIKMSEEETSRRVKWCLVCLKSYCVIFIITVISVSAYLAVGSSSTSEVDQREIKMGSGKGYKKLRLGGRKVFYRTADTDGMSNHSVLLIHGDSQDGDVFLKTGTLNFLKNHGARSVAIDIIGYGRSDPPIHIEESYEDFFEEVIQLFDLEYNLILVCVEEGCEKVLPYYLKQGVYNSKNSFIEGAVFVSPKGSQYSKYVIAGKANLPTATRTVVINGAKDEYINSYVNNQLSMVPRTELHPLPSLRNNFYLKTGISYFHAALQAFIEGLQYSYDQELKTISEQRQVQPPNNQQNYNRQQNQGSGDLFDKFQQKNAAKGNSDSNIKNDFSYDPGSRFSNIKGKRKK